MATPTPDNPPPQADTTPDAPPQGGIQWNSPGTWGNVGGGAQPAPPPAEDPDAPPQGALRMDHPTVAAARAGLGANTLKAFARGFFSVPQAMWNEKPEEVAAFQKKLGIERPPPRPFNQDDPHPLTTELGGFLEGGAGEFVGGLMFPVAGELKAAADVAGAAKDAIPTLGMRTGKEWLQKVEAGLGKLPGGAAIGKAVRRLNEHYADTTRDIVDRLTDGGDVSATTAGKAIEKQIQNRKLAMAGEGANLYGEVDRLMPPDTPVHMRNTITTLQELTTPKPGAEELSREMIDPTLQRWRQAIEKDVQEHGYLPYGAVKQIRGEVGRKLDEGVFSDLPNAQLERIYESMSSDMQNSAARVSDEAIGAVNRANTRWREIKAEQKVLQGVLNKYGGPENVFRGLMQSGQQNKWGGGATVIKQVMAAVDEPTQRLLAASALYRMGRATAGLQEKIEGDTFSAATFLTNWHGLSDDARQALFGNLPGNYSAEVTRLARNVEALKAYGKLVANPSGTAHAWWVGAELNTFIGAMLTGHFHIAGGVAAEYLGTRVASAALTNPDTVRFLADKTGQMLVTVSKGGIAVASQPAQADAQEDPDLSDLTR